jgi:hypothetical protein
MARHATRRSLRSTTWPSSTLSSPGAIPSARTASLSKGRETGGAVEIERLYKEALVLSRQVLGTAHADTLIAMRNLGEFYFDLQEFAAAEPLLVECLVGCREVFGDEGEDEQTREVMELLVSLHQAQGREDEMNAELLMTRRRHSSSR